jgi:hypothetical protein
VTDYIERMKVREILINCGDIDAEATSYVLHDIDQLPAVDLAQQPAAYLREALEQALDRLQSVEDYRLGKKAALPTVGGAIELICAALSSPHPASLTPAASEPPPDWKQDQADTSVMPRQTQAEGVSAVELIDWLETETSVFNCSFVAEKLLQKFDVRQK